MAFDDAKGMAIALEEAKKSYEEGGIPIGMYINDSRNIIFNSILFRYTNIIYIFHIYIYIFLKCRWLFITRRW